MGLISFISCCFNTPLVSWGARCLLCVAALWHLIKEKLQRNRTIRFSGFKRDWGGTRVCVCLCGPCTCCVTFPLIQWKDGSCRGEKSESTSLEQWKPGGKTNTKTIIHKNRLYWNTHNTLHSQKYLCGWGEKTGNGHQGELYTSN